MSAFGSFVRFGSGMKTKRNVLKTLVLSAFLLIAWQTGRPAAQQAPPAGAPGAGPAPGPNTLSVVQQLAWTRELSSIPGALASAQAAAAAALVRASLALPMNAADIAAKAKVLADAELALATARADAFARAQRSLQPLSAAQITTLASGIGSAPSLSWETSYYDRTGFTQLFDGKTLDGWDAEAGKWDVQDGTIHRHQTLVPKNFVDFGQYHIYYKEVFADFDLKVEFKIRSGNGGIQYPRTIGERHPSASRRTTARGGGRRWRWRDHSPEKCCRGHRGSDRQTVAVEHQNAR